MTPADRVQPVRRARLPARLVRHHFPLLILSASGVAILYATRPYRDVTSRASFATAYPALALLATTLLIGPWRSWHGLRTPASNDLRRDLGIWAGILGILHTVVGQNVHLRGRPWLYYVYGRGEHHTFPVRHDLFGAANYTGALACLLLSLLLATSNDYTLGRLQVRRWKNLQRLNYVLFPLTAIHAFAYQAIEKQKWPFVLTAVVLVALAASLQLAGLLAGRRRGAGSRPS